MARAYAAGQQLTKQIERINPSSGVGFTLATYTHATNKVQQQAAAKMGNLLKQAL